MKAETLIVCARGAEAAIVAMNRPNWEQFFPKIILISPCDDRLPGTENFGHSDHHGPRAMARGGNAYRRAAQFPAACVTEADSLFFGAPDIEDGLLLFSEIHPNGDPRFKASFYPHPPLYATSGSFSKLADALPLFDEQGMGDRVLGLAVPHLGLRMKGIGFSRNSLDTPQYLADAVRAVRNGAVCIHGVKTSAMAQPLLDGAAWRAK